MYTILSVIFYLEVSRFRSQIKLQSTAVIQESDLNVLVSIWSVKMHWSSVT